MKSEGRAMYRISEAALELGISIEWLRKGEAQGFFPPALRDSNGHRYYTEEDLERMRNRPTSRRARKPGRVPRE
jgi:DNA-binding transcriptional MerR regulator